MKYFLLLIFYATTCFGMEIKYSRLESLPSDIKWKIIQQIIRNADSSVQAINAVRTFIIGDRLFREHNRHITYQKVIRDHLGWHWNDEQPFSLWNKKTYLPKISDPELCKSQQSFAFFCNLIKEKKAVPEEILNGMDLYHGYVTQVPYHDTTLEVTWIMRRTPLYVATDANDETTAERLLQLGCDTQKLSDTDMNPLHLAAKKNYKGMVAVLIKYKAPLDAQTKRELKTAMHLAAENGHTDIMHMLVSAGARRNIKNSNGYIPAQCIKGRIAVA